MASRMSWQGSGMLTPDPYSRDVTVRDGVQPRVREGVGHLHQTIYIQPSISVITAFPYAPLLARPTLLVSL